LLERPEHAIEGIAGMSAAAVKAQQERGAERLSGRHYAGRKQPRGGHDRLAAFRVPGLMVTIRSPSRWPAHRLSISASRLVAADGGGARMISGIDSFPLLAVPFSFSPVT
jgi:hypothetical protein